MAVLSYSSLNQRIKYKSHCYCQAALSLLSCFCFVWSLDRFLVSHSCLCDLEMILLFAVLLLVSCSSVAWQVARGKQTWQKHQQLLL